MAVRLNVQKLIEDLGGVGAVTKATGITRTAPYRWIKEGGVSSYNLERIVGAFPEVDLMAYFEHS